jgi:hypothetical protein
MDSGVAGATLTSRWRGALQEGQRKKEEDVRLTREDVMSVWQEGQKMEDGLRGGGGEEDMTHVRDAQASGV